VRQALGYEQINLLGGSYGTRLGLTVMRDFPKGIRSAILDSVSPPLIHLDTAMLENFVRALDVLFADCAADLTCNAAYPDLEETLYNLSDQLATDPLNVPLPRDGVLNLTNDRFLSILWESMNHTEAIPYLPLLIHSTSRQDFAGLAALEALSDDAPTVPGDWMSEGLLWSIHCAEEWAYEPASEWQSAAKALDPSIREPVIANFIGFNDPCLIWNVSPASVNEETAVYGSVPTLLLAGEYDPATSPEWAELAAETLTQAYVFVLPGTGHVTFRTNLCSHSLISAFLDDPLHSPDASCIAKMGPPVFVTEP
jgi:pimeloyl-ACP methyl ester carboxylesterase